MNWDNLRYFLAVCRSGSVTGAGKALGVTHTTVARRITAFEQEVGARLFTRVRDGYVMTATAKDVFRDVIALEESVIDIQRAIFGRDTALQGPLKLTVPEHLANVIVAPRLRELHERYPGLDVQLLTTTALLNLSAREADVALRITRDPPDYLIGRRVVPAEQGVYASVEYLERHTGRHRLLTYPGYAPGDWIRTHFPAADVVLTTDSPGTTRAAIRRGLGLGWLPCYYADVIPELRRVELDLPPTEFSVWILSHVDLRGTARVRAVREFLIEVIEAEAPLLRGDRSRFVSL